MRYAPLLSFALFGPERLRCSRANLHHLCDTGNSTTTYTTPATRTTVMNAPLGYQPGYVAPQPTTTVIRTP